jgi:hypothetical protein
MKIESCNPAWRLACNVVLPRATNYTEIARPRNEQK